MITKEIILENSKPHPVVSNAKVVRITNDKIVFSIVGGGKGLYGDFDKTVEVGVLDCETKSFVTKFYYPDNYGDIVSYESFDRLVEKLNLVFNKGFRFT